MYRKINLRIILLPHIYGLNDCFSYATTGFHPVGQWGGGGGGRIPPSPQKRKRERRKKGRERGSGGGERVIFCAAVQVINNNNLRALHEITIPP